MAYNTVGPRRPYNYESPEQKAREVLRGQKTIAEVTQRANERAQSVAALQALAKATGVPANVLPPGGIHSGMSPQDVQAATDRINQWRGTQANQAQQNKPAAPQAAIAGVPALPKPVPVPEGSSISGQVTRNPDGTIPPNVAPKPGDTRHTPTGGMEQFVQSESGPRWVGFVQNAPAPNNLNGQVSRDPGGATRQVEQSPVPLRPTQPGQAPATLAQNRDFYSNPTQPVGTPPPAPKPWQPAPGDYAYATNGASPMQSATVTRATGSAPIAPAPLSPMGSPAPAAPVPPSTAPAPSPYAAGQAARAAIAAAPGQAAAAADRAAQSAGRAVTGAVVPPVLSALDYAKGFVGMEQNPSARPAVPPPGKYSAPPLASNSGSVAAQPIASSRAPAPIVAPPHTQIAPAAPVAPVSPTATPWTPTAAAPASSSQASTDDEEERKRRMAQTSAPTPQPYQY